ncbi:MAG TPA: hypothetical protein VK308_08330 [Pyrinomonadaceae bacterium]|nr:hypothetical protein [Pyrinomonadaceae bacterium]
MRHEQSKQQFCAGRFTGNSTLAETEQPGNESIPLGANFPVQTARKFTK